MSAESKIDLYKYHTFRAIGARGTENGVIDLYNS